MMKWWGWGSEGVEFPMAHKPDLWPWICRELGLPADARPTRPVPRGAVVLDKPVIHQGFLGAMEKVLKPGQIARDEDEPQRRLVPSPPAARGEKDVLIDALRAVGRMALDHPEIAEIEVNPLRVMREGQGSFALDVRARLE